MSGNNGHRVKAFDSRMGGIPNVRVFAMLTPAVVKQALQAARVQAPTVATTPAWQGGDTTAEVKVRAVKGGETARGYHVHRSSSGRSLHPCGSNVHDQAIVESA